VLVVNPAALPARSLDELAAAARSQPGKLNYASPGSGTPQHLAMELLKQRLGLDIVHVPYKGAAGALTDLLGGQVQMMVLPLHTALPHIRAGKLVAIGVTGESRSVLAGDIPSLAELGLKGLDLDLYFWFAAPAGTPAEVIARLNKEIADILQQPDVRDGLLKQGLIPETSTPQAIAGQIAADVERWKKFVAERKITAD
jgi:tripartite-type tricarboxylate transporter receptor subunit TctC